MDAYDPLRPPPVADWTELDESERIELVLTHHQKLGGDLPNPNAHAVVHVIVENQVALADETPVAGVMDRLMQEGLDRHEAIHAIGYVLMGTLHETTQDKSETDLTSAYYRELTQLTADKWLNQEL